MNAPLWVAVPVFIVVLAFMAVVSIWTPLAFGRGGFPTR